MLLSKEPILILKAQVIRVVMRASPNGGMSNGPRSHPQPDPILTSSGRILYAGHAESLILRFKPNGFDYVCVHAEGSMPSIWDFDIHRLPGTALRSLAKDDTAYRVCRHLLNRCLEGEPQTLEYTIRGQPARFSLTRCLEAGGSPEIRVEIRTKKDAMDKNTGALPDECETSVPGFLAELPLGIIQIGAGGRILYANATAERYLRLSSRQLEGKQPFAPDWHLINRDGSAFVYRTSDIFEAIKERREIKDRLVGVWNEDSRLYSWITVSGKPPADAGLPYLVLLNDVTELIESHDRYRTMTEHSLDSIAISDGEHWVYMNQTGLDLFEADCREKIIGRKLYDFLHPRYHGVCRERIRSVLQDNRVAELMEEEWYTCKGTLIHTEVLSVPTVLHNRRMVKIIIRDITERKRAQEMLLQSEKLNVAGQIAAAVAHEIRNPLTSLKGFIKLLRQQTGIPHRYFAIMETELERINGIAQEMLYLGKPHIADCKVHSMPAIIRQVTALMESQAHMMNVSIEEIYSQIPQVYGDENQLKQVLINLIKNAVEAMPDGGTVTVETDEADGQAVIRITDQGTGIPEELIGKIGNPFFTTKNSGTGLGLMVCRNIIKEHRGSMEVHSTAGAGTTFIILLPLHREDQPA